MADDVDDPNDVELGRIARRRGEPRVPPGDVFIDAWLEGYDEPVLDERALDERALDTSSELRPAWPPWRSVAEILAAPPLACGDEEDLAALLLARAILEREPPPALRVYRTGRAMHVAIVGANGRLLTFADLGKP